MQLQSQSFSSRVASPFHQTSPTKASSSKAPGLAARTVIAAPPKLPAAGPANAMAATNAATISRLSKSLRAMTATRQPSAHAQASQARAQREFQMGAASLLAALGRGPDYEVTERTATDLIELAGKMHDTTRTSGTNTLEAFSSMANNDATGAPYHALKGQLTQADFSEALKNLPAADLPKLGAAAKLFGKNIDEAITVAASNRFTEARNQVKQELMQVLHGALNTQTPPDSALDQLQTAHTNLKQALASQHQALGKSLPTQAEADTALGALADEIFRNSLALSSSVSTQLRGPQWSAVADTLEKAGASLDTRENAGPERAQGQKMLRDAELLKLISLKADAHATSANHVADTPAASAISKPPPTADGLSQAMQRLLQTRYGFVPTLTGHSNKGVCAEHIQKAVRWDAKLSSESWDTAKLPADLHAWRAQLPKPQLRTASQLVQGSVFAKLKTSLGTADSPIRRHDGKPGILRGGEEKMSYQFDKQNDGSLLVRCSYSIKDANNFRPADSEGVHPIDPATGHALFTVAFRVGADGKAKVAEPARFDCGSIRRHAPTQDELQREAIALSIAQRAPAARSEPNSVGPTDAQVTPPNTVTVNAPPLLSSRRRDEVESLTNVVPAILEHQEIASTTVPAAVATLTMSPP